MATRRNTTGQPQDDRIRREQADDGASALAKTIAGGRLLGRFTWAAGESKTIRHGFGRTPRGWLTVSPRDGVFLQEVSVDEDVVVISSATAGSAAVWVF